MKVILYVMYKFKINGMFLRQYTFNVSVYHIQAASLKLVFIICNEGCYGLMNCTIIGVMYGWLIGPYLAKLYQLKKLLELELYNGLLFYTGIGLCGFIKLKYRFQLQKCPNCMIRRKPVDTKDILIYCTRMTARITTNYSLNLCSLG